jgi:hypothetical protein
MNARRQQFQRIQSVLRGRRRFMNRLIVLITGLQVLAHSLFGCCVHAHAPSSGSVPSACCPHTAACPQHTHQASLPSPGGSEAVTSLLTQKSSNHEQEHQCPHDACQWIVQKVAGPSIDAATIAYLPMSAYVDDSACLAMREFTEREIRQSAAPPIRLHLWFGVLLI